MRSVGYVALLLGVLLASGAKAEPEPGQAIRLIPKTYISPGASGSIGSSQRVERHDLYGGWRLPAVSRQHSETHGVSQSQSRGALRQSSEYPSRFSGSRQESAAGRP